MIKDVKMYLGGTPLGKDLVFLDGADLEGTFSPEIDWGKAQLGTIDLIFQDPHF